MWNSKVNLKSKSLGCPHLAIFEKWGPDHLHNTRCNGVFPGKVLYVERGPTFANPRQTWATPRIKTSDPLELYSREMWATRQALLLGAHDHEPEHGRHLAHHEWLSVGKDFVLILWEQ